MTWMMPQREDMFKAVVYHRRETPARDRAEHPWGPVLAKRISPSISLGRVDIGVIVLGINGSVKFKLWQASEEAVLSMPGGFRVSMIF
jgi:hypothetical protein